MKAMVDLYPVYLACVLPVPEDKTRFSKNPDGLEWKAVLTSPQQWGKLGVQFYKAIGTWLETNQIKTPKRVVMPGGLAAVNETLKRSREGKISAEKLIIKPWAS